jgi:parallel beta-helix repeat protein
VQALGELEFRPSSAVLTLPSRNGAVVGFANGISLGGNFNNLVQEVQASGNSFDGLVVNNGLVRRNTASGNGGSGISATDSTVTENVANFNGRYGLEALLGMYGSNTLDRNGAGPVFNDITTAAMGLPAEAFQETNFFTAPAFAVDGVILINQATVMAAGGFPYKITRPGSYKLSGNLVVTTAIAEAIVISSDDVTLDLNGFSISCNDPVLTRLRKLASRDERAAR